MSIRKTTYVILVIIAVVALGIVLTAGDQDTEPADDGNQQSTTTATTTADHFTDHSDPLAGTSTDYYPQEEDVNGYLSLPETASADEPAPAVILVHEWWGLNEDIKQMADDFADQGYVALAVDMYGQPPTASSSVAQTRSGQVRSNIDAAMANLDAAKTYLEDRDDVDRQRIGSVGWCFGGDWAYRLAAENMGLEGSVMYYGQFDPQDDFNSMRASILGHFGEEDSIVDVSNAREFKANLEQADEESAVYIYPNVGHGFANYRAGENLEYDRESAERAWSRTLDFLDTKLNDQAQTSARGSGANQPGTASDTPKVSSSSGSSTIFLRYSESQGQDVLSDGDQIGRTLELTFSGGYDLYDRIYRQTDEGRYTEERLVQSGMIAESRVNELQSLFVDSGFYSYPTRVPQFEGRPQIEGPADTVSISARSDMQADLKRVRHKEGARGGSYPDGFQNLQRAAKTLLQNVATQSQ